MASHFSRGAAPSAEVKAPKSILKKDVSYWVDKLCKLHSQVRFDRAGRLDSQRKETRGRCEEFLDMLSRVADELNLKQADRSYRSIFSHNYQLLFSKHDGRYMADIFDALFDQLKCIRINAEHFRLSTEAQDAAVKLGAVWHLMHCLLRGWRKGELTDLSNFKPLLLDFEQAWVVFEKAYIEDLMRVEAKSRCIILELFSEEASLERSVDDLDNLPAQGRFVEHVGKLNSVANLRRQGRDDLGVEILRRAFKFMNAADSKPGDVGLDIAVDVVRSLEHLRQHFADMVAQGIANTDPFMANNMRLVKLLIHWEEAWETADRYLMSDDVLMSLDHVTAGVRRAATYTASVADKVRPGETPLADMIKEYDAEVFLVLPRIVCLLWLQQPRALLPLLDSVSPGCFDPGAQLEASPEARNADDFANEFRYVTEKGYDEGSLIRRAVFNDDSNKEPLHSFMRELEKWSMTLQRQRPVEWNLCCSVILRCLAR